MLTNAQILEHIALLMTDLMWQDYVVDLEARTVLWTNVIEQQYCVNQFIVHGDRIGLNLTPIMCFPIGSL